MSRRKVIPRNPMMRSELVMMYPIRDEFCLHDDHVPTQMYMLSPGNFHLCAVRIMQVLWASGKPAILGGEKQGLFAQRPWRGEDNGNRRSDPVTPAYSGLPSSRSEGTIR